MGIKGRPSVAAPLASDFCMSDHLQLSISHFWPSNVAKSCQRNSRHNGLNIRNKKNTVSNELAKHRNQVCKTRHSLKFASLNLVQLAPRSFCHTVDGISEQPPKFNFSREEFRKTSSRSVTPSAPLVPRPKHLECSKGDCGEQRDGNLLPLLLQVTFASPTICNCLFHSFGLSMLPDVVKETAVTMALTFEKNTNWPNIATKFAKRGTLRSLLLSNWSSWHRAASATQVTEFESNT